MKIFIILFFLLPTLASAQTLDPISYERLSGWQNVQHKGALIALRTQCEKGAAPKPTSNIYTPKQWHTICRAAKAATLNAQGAQRFFETHFTPMRAKRTSGEEGFLTGYFIPELEARLKKGGAFQFPAYALPPEEKDRSLARGAIDAGMIGGKGLELIWLNDPIDLFFLQVQGSGFVRLADGSRRQLAYAGTNDLPYQSIGKVIIAGGYIAKEKLDYATLKGWLKDNRILARDIMPKNPRYVFFSLKQADEVIGAANVPLTANHSLAVDPAHLPYGVPVLLSRDTDPNRYNGKELPEHFFVVTGDTGGAIKGELRGDVYFGAGALAEKRAGALRHDAQWVVLVPK